MQSSDWIVKDFHILVNDNNCYYFKLIVALSLTDAELAINTLLALFVHLFV